MKASRGKAGDSSQSANRCSSSAVKPDWELRTKLRRAGSSWRISVPVLPSLGATASRKAKAGAFRRQLREHKKQAGPFGRGKPSARACPG